MNITNYLKFLSYFQNMLNKDFADQAPYIKCKMGCAKCCQNGNYPFSQMELEFLKQEFKTLLPEVQEKIRTRIKDLIKQKNESKDETFMHECPFLIDNVCSVYNCRGIICRTFGLIYYNESDRMQMPFCAYQGLNYSEIMDFEKNIITEEKLAEAGYGVEPKSYNLDYNKVTDSAMAESFGFSYGEKGPLLDILEKDDYFNPPM